MQTRVQKSQLKTLLFPSILPFLSSTLPPFAPLWSSEDTLTPHSYSLFYFIYFFFYNFTSTFESNISLQAKEKSCDKASCDENKTKTDVEYEKEFYFGAFTEIKALKRGLFDWTWEHFCYFLHTSRGVFPPHLSKMYPSSLKHP